MTNCIKCGAAYERSPSEIKHYSYVCVKCRYKLYQKRLTEKYLEKKPWYRYLQTLRKRCNQPSHDSYRYYGARGIKALISADELKQLWFRDGAADMTQPSIDRIDADGHYEIGNCRFIEMTENKRRWL